VGTRGLLAATGTYALLFTLAQYLQQGLGDSALVSGLTLVPWVAAFGVAGQIGGALGVAALGTLYLSQSRTGAAHAGHAFALTTAALAATAMVAAAIAHQATRRERAMRSTNLAGLPIHE
jgi:hypothetical protein